MEELNDFKSRTKVTDDIVITQRGDSIAILQYDDYRVETLVVELSKIATLIEALQTYIKE